MKPLHWLACFVVGGGAVGARAADADACRVHVILFVPADVKPPVGYQQRFDQIAGYAESFFQRELKRWKHDKLALPFHRSTGGGVEVTLVRGKEATEKYKPVDVRMEVMNGLRQQGKINAARQVWWIFVYAGDPPKKFPGYLGGFGPEIGGWAVCNYDTTPGAIDPQMPLGADFLEKLTLKGMIHELGHGFQMPHIGPLKWDAAGNTLMGPTHYHFRRVAGADEDRVYLCEAEAAMLANHPAFRGVTHQVGPLPTVEVQNAKYTANAAAGKIVVGGRVKSSRRAVYAFVADESDARPGEYWTKTYVGKVAPNGDFEVIVTEPSESSGTLRTWFAFENGDQTGDGKTRGRDSGISKAYTFKQGRWTIP